MIEATFFIDNNFYYSFAIKGHANYNNRGNDIVCAAVSSAVDMTINSIKDILDEDCYISIDYNKAIVNIKLKSKDNYIASLLIQSLYKHLINISKNYPNNIRVKID